MGSNSSESGATFALPEGFQDFTRDWSADKQTFQVPWGKAMMWIFLLSDTFIFACFLTSYMNVRMSTRVPWPNPSEVFALSFGGDPHPTDPNRYHDLCLDYQQRHDGVGC